jgi:hypothetical protein
VEAGLCDYSGASLSRLHATILQIGDLWSNAARGADTGAIKGALAGLIHAKVSLISYKPHFLTWPLGRVNNTLTGTAAAEGQGLLLKFIHNPDARQSCASEKVYFITTGRLMVYL